MGFFRRALQPFADVGGMRWIIFALILVFFKWSNIISLLVLGFILGTYFLFHSFSGAYRLPFSSLYKDKAAESGGFVATGKHVLITGASAGLGASLSLHSLYRRARRVTLMARRKDPLINIQKELIERAKKQNWDVSIQVVTADTQDADDVARAFCCAKKGEGIILANGDAEKDKSLPIDFLICNAGVAYPSELDKLSDAQIHTMINTNLCGTIYCVRQVIQEMKERRNGAILLVSSEAGLCPVYGFTVYSATKSAILALATALDQELRFYNIFIASVLPPTMKTPGLEAEAKIIPKITLDIEATTTMADPSVVSSHIFESVKRGRRLISYGYVGYALTLFAGGFAPVNNYYDFVVQVFGSGILRLVALFLSTSWFKIIWTGIQKQEFPTEDQKA